MEIAVGNGVIEIRQGDITQEEVDAIVNAANSRLAGGGGVDGAIHRRGGAAILRDTNAQYPNGCPTGSAVISTAGNLRARFVIHAVGPVWSGGQHGEAALLACAFRRSLELAAEYHCESVAMPALSAGAYGYPMREAAMVAITTAVEFLRAHDQPRLIRFVLFDARAYGVFEEVLQLFA